MAHDFWTVATCENVHLNVISTFPVLQDSYFFEVKVLSCSKAASAQCQSSELNYQPALLLGWISRLSCLPEWSLADIDDRQSAFYRLQGVTPGEVIGCLADVNSKYIRFYRNGRMTNKCKFNHDVFSYLPLFAYVRLLPEAKLKLRLNFGDSDFAFAPWKIFSFQNNPDQSLYSALPKRKLRNHWKWGDCRSRYKNKNASRYLFFEYNETKKKGIGQSTLFPPPIQDELQQKFDQMIEKMDEMLDEKLIAEEDKNNQFFKIKNNDLCLVRDAFCYEWLQNLDDYGRDMERFFQAFVERFGSGTRRQALSNRAFAAIFHHLDWIWGLRGTNDTRWLHTVLLHYLPTSLQLDSAADKRKLVNFCLFQMCFTGNNNRVHCDNDFSFCCQAIKRKRDFFLFKALRQCTDQQTQLYAFTVLKQIGFDFVRYPLHTKTTPKRPPPVNLSRECTFFTSSWHDRFSRLDELANLKNVSDYALQLQLYLYANHYYERLISPEESAQFIFSRIPNKSISLCQTQTQTQTQAQTSSSSLSADDNFLKLNPEDRSSSTELLLSPSNLMARNDSLIFQTVRSKFTISPGTFYFEVTLLTAGLMRIGLATSRMDIKRCKAVGDDAFSIGLDGFHRVVVMNRREYAYNSTTLQTVPPWKVGDVVGVYFDSARSTILFGLNQVVIELANSPFQPVELGDQGEESHQSSFIFSVLPCHVAVSLGLMQQCYFNFRCKPLEAFLQKINQLDNSFGSGLQTVNITNSMVLSGATNRMGNFSAVSSKGIICFCFTFINEKF